MEKEDLKKNFHAVTYGLCDNVKSDKLFDENGKNVATRATREQKNGKCEEEIDELNYLSKSKREALQNSALLEASMATFANNFQPRLESHGQFCLVCGSNFQTVSKLQSHILQEHIGADGLNCLNPKTITNSQDVPGQEPLGSLHHKRFSEASASKHEMRTNTHQNTRPTSVGYEYVWPYVSQDLSKCHSSYPQSYPGSQSDLNNSLNSQFSAAPFSTFTGPFGLLNPFLAYQYLLNANGLRLLAPLSASGIRSPLFGEPILGLPNSVNGFLFSRNCFPSSDSSFSRSSLSPESNSSTKKSRASTEEHDNSRLNDVVRDVNLKCTRKSSPINCSNQNYIESSNGKYSEHLPSLQLSPGMDACKESNLNNNSKQVVSKGCSSSAKKKSLLNARSIEQHISKIISNNEKVLTNPELEKVKPRRVFRRNSLDPSSLSSGSSAVPENRHYDSISKEDFSKNLIRSNKKNLKQLSRHLSTSYDTEESKKVIQLRRAPLLVHDGQQRSDAPGLTHFPTSSYEANRIYDRQNKSMLLGKRGSMFGSLGPYKKPRRMSLYECYDCGARYRKEENYIIHKRDYCVFRGDMKYDVRRIPHESNLSLSSALAHDKFNGDFFTKQFYQNAVHSSASPDILSKNNDPDRTNNVDTNFQNDEPTISQGVGFLKWLSLNNQSLHPKKNEVSVTSSAVSDKNLLQANSQNIFRGKHHRESRENSSAVFENFLTLPSSSHCEDTSEDSSTPRNNYKLLVHQLSLKNMNDVVSQSLRSNQRAEISQENMMKYFDENSFVSDTGSLNSYEEYVDYIRKKIFKTNSFSSQNETKEIFDKYKPKPDEMSELPFFYNADDYKKLKTSSDCKLIAQSNKIIEHLSSSSQPQNSAATERNVEEETQSKLSDPLVIHPHTKAVLDGETYTAFCCVISPQPACVEAGKEDNLSMYSDWAVSEPFLIPSGLNIDHILDGWRHITKSFNHGFVVSSKTDCSLVSTETKDYKPKEESSSTKPNDIFLLETFGGNAKTYSQNLELEAQLRAWRAPNEISFYPKSIYTSCNQRRHKKLLYENIHEFNVRNSTLNTDALTSKEGRSDLRNDTEPFDTDHDREIQSFPSSKTSFCDHRDKESRDKNHHNFNTDSSSSPLSVQPVHQEGCCNSISSSSDDCSLCQVKAGKIPPNMYDGFLNSKTNGNPSLLHATLSDLTSQKRVSSASISNDPMTSSCSKKYANDVVYENNHSEGQTRTFHCRDCNVAFRIGGHLAKHLRSKGHAIAVQKRNITNLKKKQLKNPQDIFYHQSTSGTSSTSLHSKAVREFEVQSDSVAFALTSSSSILRDNKHRREEEASRLTSTDAGSGREETTLSSLNDPRPFKCSLCQVAFRFQGHLERHFRSNNHLITVSQIAQNEIYSKEINMSISSQGCNTKTNISSSSPRIEESDCKIQTSSPTPTSSLPMHEMNSIDQENEIQDGQPFIDPCLKANQASLNLLLANTTSLPSVL